MKKLVATLSLLLGVTSGARAELSDVWSTNYAASLLVAAEAKQPALVYFTAGWCGPCTLMRRVTLSEPAVQLALSNFARVVLDIDDERDLAEKYSIDAVPTFVLLTPAGEEVQRVTGFQAAGEFLLWLTNGLSGAREANLHRALVQNELADVDRLLTSTNADVVPQCVAKLFGLCAERNEQVVQSAAKRLRILAARQPAALLDGLNDPRLATRIQVAKALRAQLVLFCRSNSNKGQPGREKFC